MHSILKAPSIRGILAVLLSTSLMTGGALGCASVQRMDGPGMVEGPTTSASAPATDAVPLPEASAVASAAPSESAPVTSSAPTAVASAALSSSALPSSDAPGKPVKVTVGDPKFEGGEVPKAKAALDRMAKTIKKCVNENGGLSADKGTIDLQFLVRAQGIAEGVDLQNVKGIGTAAKKCVRDAFKKKTIGPPSSDPVGVTVKIELEPA